MGKQLTAYLLDQGFRVHWVKATPFFGERAALVDKLKKQLSQPALAERLTLWPWVDYQEAWPKTDLVLEAIIEDLAIKRDYLEKFAAHYGAEVAIASNTSSLSVQQMAAGMRAPERFLGLHFFNPVSTSALVEMVPGPVTQDSLLQKLEDWLYLKLGKKPIRAHDVPGFVANRIGFFSNYDIMRRAEALGWPVNKTDALSGKYLGRTKMGPYRLTDLTGVDLFEDALVNYQTDEHLAPFLPDRTAQKALLKAGYVGDKVGQGYYKKAGGQRFVYDFKAADYVPADFPRYPILDVLDNLHFEERFTALFHAEDAEGRFMWESLARVLYMAAWQVGVACADYRDVDRALVWGYHWRLGPFQIWQMVGYERVKADLAKRFGALPDWLPEDGFYTKNASLALRVQPDQYVDRVLKDEAGLYRLYSTTDGIWVFENQTRNSVIKPSLLKAMRATLHDLKTSSAPGLVLTSAGENFSVGYDVTTFAASLAADRLLADSLANNDLGHEVIQALWTADRPVSVALTGFTLGGGAEIALAASHRTASQTLRMGLPEVGMGLIPGGGGLVMLARQVYQSALSRAEKKRQLEEIFTQVAYGLISQNAADAQEKGYLQAGDTLVRQEELVLEAALAWVQDADRYGFTPKTEEVLPVMGTELIAIIQGITANWLKGDFITPHQKQLADAIGVVLAGGRVPMGAKRTVADFFAVEQAEFVQLLKTKETQAILHKQVKGAR